jgi:nitrite reductase/ring-hydroxylating ferredoxin subunit
MTGAPAIRLCALDELPEGGARGFDPHGAGEDTIFAVRPGPTTVRVFINRCPHVSAPLEYRKDRFLAADGAHIMCHAHGALFDRATGLCVYGPCLGQSLTAVPCWIEQGGVWVMLRECQASG